MLATAPRSLPSGAARRLALAEPLLVALAAPLLLFPRGQWAHLGLALLGVGWLLGWLGAERGRRRTPLDFAIALLALSALLGLYPSRDLALSLPRLYGLLLGLGVYYAALRCATDSRRFWLALALPVAAIVPVGAIGLAGTAWSAKIPLFAPLYPRLPRLITEVQASAGTVQAFNPNELGGALAFLLPLPLALLLGGRLRPLAWLAIAAPFAFGLGVWALAASRTAYVALALVALALLVWRWHRVGGVLALAALLGAGYYLSQYDGAALGLATVAGLEDALDSLPLSQRPAIWSRAATIIADFPFTGIGLNTFDLVGADYALGSDPGSRLVHAHNLFLQTALDLGLVGLLAFLGLCLASAVAGVRAYRTLGDGRGRPTAEQAALAGLLGGLAAYLLFGLADAITLGAKPTVLVWLMLGLVVAAGRLAGVPQPPLVPLRWRYALLATAALAGLVLAPYWLGALAVNLGRIDLGRGLPAGAIALAEEALSWQGDNPRAHLLLGTALRRAGQEARALAALRQAVALDPADAAAQYQLAEALAQSGDADAAVPHWRAAGAAPALYARAQAARTAKDLPNAARWFDLSTRVDPSHLHAWLGLAQSLAADQRWEEAAAAYGQLIDRFPQSRYGYEGRADLLYNRLKDRPAALAVVQAGLARVEDNQAQLYNLRSTYRAAATPPDLPGAQADARAAIDLAPTNGWYRSWLGDLHLREKRYAEALAEYAAIPAATSDQSWRWRSRQKAGAVWSAQKEWQRAIDDYAAAVQLSQEQALAPATLASNHAQLGAILAQAGRTAEAIEAYETALAHDPANASYPKTLEGLRKVKK
ncbi:MAG: tetratricopeptide repeat protein [Chloroflexota bacterium]